MTNAILPFKLALSIPRGPGIGGPAEATWPGLAVEPLNAGRGASSTVPLPVVASNTGAASK